MTNREKRFWNEAIVDLDKCLWLCLGDPCVELRIPPKAFEYLKEDIRKPTPSLFAAKGRKDPETGNWIVRIPHLAIDSLGKVFRLAGSGEYVVKAKKPEDLISGPFYHSGHELIVGRWAVETMEQYPFQADDIDENLALYDPYSG